MVSLFEEQVRRTPDHPALLYQEECLTYRHLLARVNQMANYLRRRGVGAQVLVGVCLPRTTDLIVSLLAILKAGGAYVPIDPAYPRERIQYMVEDSRAALVLTTTREQALLQGSGHTQIICLDQLAIELSAESEELEVSSEGRWEELAYVIYTSGSTGKPKGVMIEHGNATAFVRWCQDEFIHSPFEVVYAATSICFDLSIYELFYTLSIGRTIRLLDSGLHIADALAREASRAVLLNTVPSIIRHLLNEGADWAPVTVINMAGEPIPVDVHQRVDLVRIEVRNLYGPSEDTTYSTCQRLLPNEPVLIGRPISNTQVYIVDEQLQLLPLGATGELCISGDGLSRGYLNKPELTAEKFIANPFPGGGSRLYRTGDLARWRPDGVIDYVGRLDTQVKIRGYRIELGEVETRLQQVPGVAQAVVLARPDASGALQLVGYIVAEEGSGFEPATATTHLRVNLPEYMVPSTWVEMPSLPLTPNGKVDKQALPDPQPGQFRAQDYLAPRTETEQQLVAIWQRLLQVEHVGIQDDFFALGGHSLLAAQLMVAIERETGTRLPLATVLTNPTVEQQAQCLAQPLPTGTELGRQERPAAIPLAFMQEGLWLVDQLEGGSVHYNVPLLLRLRGVLNEAALRLALWQLVERHESLRTVIVSDGLAPQQRVLPATGWKPDLSTTADCSDDAKQVRAWLARSFDLARDYPIRARLWRGPDDNENLLTLAVHHIACDGWSLGILVRELAQAYEAALAGSPPQWPALPVQYADYAIWQRRQLTDEVLAPSLAYWQEQLAGLSPLPLPTDFERPPVPSQNGNLIHKNLPAELQQGLEQVSRREGATLFMGLLAGFQVLLARYSGQNDICVGTPVAGRTQAAEEPLVGLLVNTVALRGNVAEAACFTELLRQVKHTTLVAYAHQHVPFERVVEAVAPQRDLSRNPLFQVMFSLYNAPAVASEQAWGGLAVNSEAFDWSTSKFDLAFDIDHTPEGLLLNVEYNCDLFEESTVRRMMDHYELLLTGLAARPDAPLAQVKMLSAGEEQQLIHEFNATAKPAQMELTTDQLIDQIAERSPERVAIVHDKERITYGALRKLAERTATFLTRHVELAEEAIVGVLTDRSISMLAGIYGVWKAGGAYVPLHPELPADRLQIVLEDAEVGVLLYQHKYASLALEVQRRCPGLRHLICLDATVPVAAAVAPQFNHALPPAAPTPFIRPPGRGNAGLAYVLYTSGSTGRPKGAMVEHQGMLNHLFGMVEELAMDQDSRMAQNASQSFDVSVWQMFVALIIGGQTVILDPEVVLQPAEFVGQATEQGVTVLEVVPSYLSVLLEETSNYCSSRPLASLRQLLVTGETVTRQLLARWFQQFPNVPVVNAYGPTEAADDVTLHHLREVPARTIVPIGRPIRNTRIYLVSANGQLCPVGVKGEIWVSGLGVGRGYVNDPAKTAAAFSTDPFCGEPGVRLYKTGDLGRRLSDGTIEFFGRQDYQVKIRGHRIELGEIEQHLAEVAGVREAVVVDRQDAAGQPFICAYFTADEPTLDTDAIKQALARRLPAYMLPAFLLQLPMLPLTPNGKVDRKALPEPTGHALGSVPERTAPRTATEQHVLLIWQELLGRVNISVTDNFFTLGGHSLKVTQLTSRLYREFGVKLPLREVFVRPTLEAIATFVDVNRQAAYTPIPLVAKQPFYETSNAQKRLWIIDQLEDNLAAYNSYMAYCLRGTLNVAALQAAVDLVVARHETLRTTFLEVGGEPKQRIHAPGDLPTSLDVVDYRHGGKTPAAVEAELAERGQAPINLQTGPLFQLALYLLPNDTYYLFCVMHHIICDGWSNNLLIEELLTSYQALADDSPITLPPLPIQYKDYAAWQTTQLTSPEMEQHRHFWLEQLAGDLPVLNFPNYRPRPPVQTFNGRTLEHRFNFESLRHLRQLSAQGNASLFVTLTALLNVLLYRYTGQRDIILGAATAGRNHPDLERQLGYYLNTILLRNTVEPAENFLQLLERVKQSSISAFEHQDYPFDLLINQLESPRDLSRNPVFDVLIILQNFDEDETSLLHKHLGELHVEPVDLASRTTVFDLDFDFTESRTGLELHLSYNTDLYDQEQMHALLRHLEVLITQAATTIKPVAKLDLLGEADLLQLAAFNDTAADLPVEITYHQYVEQFAQQTPDQTAVICNERRLSYHELNAGVNKLARAIARHVTLGEDDLVAVYMDRSEHMIQCILALWKSGAAYIPVETRLPLNRVEGIVQDAGTKLVIAQRSGDAAELRQRIQAQCPVLYLEDLLAEAEQLDDSNLNRVVNPDSLAFVIFTSGSTGKPKGAMIEHRGRMNHSHSTAELLGMNKDTVLVQNASHSFDISVWQSFNAFVRGGTTLIYDDELVAQPERLLRDMVTNRATHLQVVPSYLAVLLDLIEKDPAAYNFSLVRLLSCGERLPPALAERWLTSYPHIRMVNDFGPAEAADGTSLYQFDQVPAGMTNIPIGRSVHNMANYIADEHLNLCPVGVMGELCVAGVGVGRGYINDPERTGQAFMVDPFAPEKNQRLYRTGDLARYLPSGLLEFHGRKDYQVKVNGQRIELGEIETKLTQLAGVKDAVVLAKEEANGRKYLLGFVVPSTEDSTADSIRKALAAELPPYMLPRQLHLLATLPMTNNGKVDRRKLDQWESEEPVEKAHYHAPSTEVEALLAEAWASVLKRERMSVTDNFYDAGGDSISAIQVASRLYKEGYKVDIRDVMRQPTIRELAPLVRPLQRVADQAPVVGKVPLTPIQADFFATAKANANHYHQSLLLAAASPLEPVALQAALDQLLRTHDALRMSYHRKAAGQVIQLSPAPGAGAELRVYDMRDSANPGPRMQQHAQELQAAFDLSVSPLLKGAIFQTEEQDFLLLVGHHLVIDGVSWRILLEDLTAGYQAAAQGQAQPIPLKTDSFRTWAQQLAAYATSPAFTSEKLYWQRVADFPTQTIPRDLPAAGPGRVGDRAEVAVELNVDYTTALLTQAHRAFGTNTDDLLLTALALATHQVFGLQKLAVMLESHGRSQQLPEMNLTRTVGWFTSEYPVCLDLAPDHDLAQRLKVVKETLRRVPHLGTGYGLLHQHGIAPVQPRPQLVLNYLGQLGNDDEADFFQLQPYSLGCDEAPDNQCDYELELIGSVQQDRLSLTLHYPDTHFLPHTMQQWMQAYQQHLEMLIDFCAQRQTHEVTPSDFEYQDFSLDDLDTLQLLFD
ncbi:non-ribosomal peptide synthetase [Hymenobacter actinosclerus]|nr:non-ribosomal peptide synthetase [Hymenobacter actinosclerus]